MSNRLLVVDDDLEICMFVARVAKSCDYDTAIASTAQEFLDRVDDWDPTHIMLDLAMPQVDGVEMLGHLAASGSRAQIIIASGFEQRVVDVAGRVGAARGLTIAATLTKPIRADLLRGLLERIRIDDNWLSEATLETAIAQDQLFLVYQPKVELATQRVVGYEALLRWKHPTRGMVSPAEFISFAESSGEMMDRVTAWVINSAIRQLAAWRAIGLETEVALNLSAKNLKSHELADNVAMKCRDADILPEQIVFELTETAAMGNFVDAMELLTRLRIKGIRLSIDDFGTGFSSLAQLHRLPFSELKIDRAFVADCDRSRDSAVIVKTMADLARNLGLISVAEGVETEGALRMVGELGCAMAQGYYIAKPMLAGEVSQWAQSWTARA